MAQFRTDLREQLRDDLMKNIGTALRDNLVKEIGRAMHDVLSDMVDHQVFEAVDRLLDSFFADEDMDAWLSFTKDGPRVLVGLGPGECAAQFTPLIEVNNYHGIRELNREQQIALLDQITSIKTFIAELETRRGQLEEAMKPYLNNVLEFPK